jgi:hypothetical protein
MSTDENRHVRRAAAARARHAQAELDAALKSIAPLLKTASKALHELDKLQPSTPEQSELHRLVALGQLVDCAGQLCGPNAWLMSRLVLALGEFHHGEEELEPVHQCH